MANTIGSLLEAKLAALERNAAVRHEMPSPHHENFFFFSFFGGKSSRDAKKFDGNFHSRNIDHAGPGSPAGASWAGGRGDTWDGGHEMNYSSLVLT